MNRRRILRDQSSLTPLIFIDLLFLFISGGLYFDGRKVRAEESISYGYK